MDGGPLHRLIAFFVDNFPGPELLAVGVPLGLALSWLFLEAAARLRTRRGWATGYTRKTFHFLVFGTATALQAAVGTPALCLFGGMASLLILHAVVRGAGHPHYEALAREKDAPRRTHYVVVPYFATLIGGIAGNVLFGPAALVGYLVTGLGDAVGEPVGTRFGRHPYHVPALRGVHATRTLEGSAAVWVTCTLAVVVGAAVCPELVLDRTILVKAPFIAACCAAVEAISPHGWDNTTLQLTGTGMAAWLLH